MTEQGATWGRAPGRCSDGRLDAASESARPRRQGPSWPSRRSAGCGWRWASPASATGWACSPSPRWPTTWPAAAPRGQYLAVAGVFILRLAPAVVLGPLAGALADRISRRWVLVYGDVLRFADPGTIPFVGTLWWLYVATLLIECVGLFWLPAKDATMPNLVPRKRLEAANQLSLFATYGIGTRCGAVPSRAWCCSTACSSTRSPTSGSTPRAPTSASGSTPLSYLVSGLVIWRLDFPTSVNRDRRASSRCGGPSSRAGASSAARR